MIPKETEAHMDKFWCGGGEAYEKALREQYQSECKRLQEHLAECNDPIKRQALTEELETLKKDFDNRLRSIDRSLF